MEGRDIFWPKMLMVFRLQALLQQARVIVPKTEESKVLVTELENFETRYTEALNCMFAQEVVGEARVSRVALELWERY